MSSAQLAPASPGGWPRGIPGRKGTPIQAGGCLNTSCARRKTKKQTQNPVLSAQVWPSPPKLPQPEAGSRQGWSTDADGAAGCLAQLGSPTFPRQPRAQVSSCAHPGEEAGPPLPWDPAFCREAEGTGDAGPGAAGWAGGSSRCRADPAGQCQEGRAVCFPWPCQLPTAAVCSCPLAKLGRGSSCGSSVLPESQQALRVSYIPPQTQQRGQQPGAAAGKGPAIYFAGEGPQEPAQGTGEEPPSRELVIPARRTANEISNRNQPL